MCVIIAFMFVVKWHIDTVGFRKQHVGNVQGNYDWQSVHVRSVCINSIQKFAARAVLSDDTAVELMVDS